MTSSRKKIEVKGTVQGVGFRPFVYKIARALELSGHVFNSSAGVVIEVEGPDACIADFLAALKRQAPPLSRIDNILIADLPPEGGGSFSIRESESAYGQFALVPPDVGTCNDCWRDFSNPQDRRYGYPFTNCINCGPRYTIIRDIPYDRLNTTMALFRMCELCRAEYEDPSNRRFHAQPNACPLCGPTLAIVKSGTDLPTWPLSHTDSFLVIKLTRQLLQDGHIVAVRGLGGFLLACDARNAAAVNLLRQRKRRSDKPFALMVRDVQPAEALCHVSDSDRAALISPRRPIVVLTRRQDVAIPNSVAPGNKTLGIMLPSTPLHYLMFSDSPEEASQFPALVMTSGNISEEPIAVSNEDAWTRLQSVADWFLIHNREIYMRADDSVVRTFHGRESVVRRSRGYVPDPIDLGIDSKSVLACGADLKNTFCLTKDHYAIVSQHIGDLQNYETLLFFQETLANLTKLFRVQPEAVAYDLHPQYMSSGFARGFPADRKIGIQHHHAHIASCMAENRIRGKVIGVAMDGTGYGTDGQIWGGEFFLADYGGFERRAHLRYIALPGGDAAVRHPWRMALSYLIDTFGSHRLPDLPFLSMIPANEASLVTSMISKRLNTVQTSSSGRLYDAVAALVGLRTQVNFEGQAAIELEMLALEGVEERYRFLVEELEPLQLDMRPMIEDVVRDIHRSKSVGHISACFHNTVSAAIIEVCNRIRTKENVPRVCLSGGTFQNMLLLDRCVRGLSQAGFEVYFHERVPPNDGGISLGQAVIASEIVQRGE